MHCAQKEPDENDDKRHRGVHQRTTENIYLMHFTYSYEHYSDSSLKHCHMVSSLQCSRTRTCNDERKVLASFLPTKALETILFKFMIFAFTAFWQKDNCVRLTPK
eukprot:1047858-Amphidinium_carterae.3